MKLLDIVHPAAKALVDIARSQDNEVGDGTTTVVVLAGEFLKEVRSFIEEGVNPRTIVRGYREAGRLAVEKVREIAVKIERNDETYSLVLHGLTPQKEIPRVVGKMCCNCHVIETYSFT